MEYYVKNETVSEIVINKSRFIAILIPFHDKVLLQARLSQVKFKYPAATHYCYAYLIGNKLMQTGGFSDDGEPVKTAGQPIFDAIIANKIYDCLLVVVRYFGGIMLGAGGLIRAYKKSALAVCINALLYNKHIFDTFRVEVSYQQFDNLNYLITNQELVCKITSKTFDSIITCTILIKKGYTFADIIPLKYIIGYKNLNEEVAEYNLVTN